MFFLKGHVKLFTILYMVVYGTELFEESQKNLQYIVRVFLFRDVPFFAVAISSMCMIKKIVKS